MAIFKQIDTDGSGTITFKEFMDDFKKSLGECEDTDIIQSIFDSFDTNKDGVLTLDELEKMFL